MHTIAAADYPTGYEVDAGPNPDAAGSAPVLRLAVSGLAPDEYERLRSILAVLQPRAHRPWRLCEGAEADLHLSTRDRAPPTARNGLVGVIVREGETQAASDDLALPLPFRVMSVLELLEAASERLQRIGPERPGAAVAVHADAGRAPANLAAGTGEDGKALASALARIVERRLEQNLRVRIVGFGTLHLCPATREYGIDFEPARLDPALEAHRFVLTTVSVDAPELITVHTRARPIDEVLWRIGLLATWEREGLAVLRFSLSRWPDLARLPHRAEHITLCATLAARPCSVAELVTATGVARVDVIHFLHACELCGLTRTSTELAATPIATSSGGGLFDRLRRRFGF